MCPSKSTFLSSVIRLPGTAIRRDVIHVISFMWKHESDPHMETTIWKKQPWDGRCSTTEGVKMQNMDEKITEMLWNLQRTQMFEKIEKFDTIFQRILDSSL